jgi:uncharacterized protein (DUF1919 family)
MNNIIISNTCVGRSIIIKNNIFPYNNPFIGSLIPNDLEYVKLINNFNYYINIEPRLEEPKNNTIFSIQNKSKYYLHKDIQTPYPVIHLDDIEIHFIHDFDNEKCIDKFKRRLDRLKNIINNNDYKIIVTLSFSEIINNHDNILNYINEYFKNNNELNIEKYFIGPNEYNNGNINYININKWNNIKLNRDSSHIYDFNDQPFSINILSGLIFKK